MIKKYSNKLEKIIREHVRRTILEGLTIKYLINDENIPLIDIETLKKTCFDFRLIPQLTVYGDKLSSLPYLNEAYGDIVEPDEVVNKLIKRYHLNSSLINKFESHNRIYVYVIVADIEINAKLISDDMEKMGYFLGVSKPYAIVDGIEFVCLQFEPMCYQQKNETETIKNTYDFLYHWTPTKNVESILQHGLIPSHKNNIFNYPNRTYLIKGNANDEDIKFLGWSISCNNNEKKYTLLKIDIEKLDDSVNFYLDSNSQIGIYTEDIIPAEYIKIEGNITFPTLGGK